MSSGIVRIVLGAVLTVFLGSWALASLGLLLGGLVRGGDGAQLIGNVIGFLIAGALTLLAVRRLLLKGLAQRQAARAARSRGTV